MFGRVTASFFSLNIPGLESAKGIFAYQWIAAIAVTTGVLIGAADAVPGAPRSEQLVSRTAHYC